MNGAGSTVPHATAPHATVPNTTAPNDDAPGSLPALSLALAASPAVQAHPRLTVAPPDRLRLPVRAVQFGTGAFLRGFVDDLLDAANRQGLFNGRVVAIGSTDSGRDRQLGAQDGLYTVVERGLVHGAPHEAVRVVSSVRGALAAQTAWGAVLALARAPALELVFSNTTEVGIALDETDAFHLAPPRSFPGKLARFLYERGRAFGWAADQGVVVLPCELIEDNGDRLRDVVRALAARWRLEPAFRQWLDAAVPFCNTLVDRIVPGAPSPGDAAALERALGYRDALLTACEPYRLFAIEAPASVRPRLAFAAADPGVVLADDVRPYRERKVRLLNGAHSALVATALLAGCETVLDAVRHPRVGPFLRRLLLDEIVPTVDAPGAAAFARAVLDRFANPYMQHALWDITLQGTRKMRVRVVPTVARFAAQAGAPPPALAFGFAAYLAFLRGGLHARRQAAGLLVPADEQGGRVRALWDAHLPHLPADVDGTAPRASAPHAGMPNTDVPDTGVPDTGVPDTVVADTGVPDTGVPDTGVADTGVPDTGVPDTAVPNASAVAPFVRAACSDAELWGADLAALPGFAGAVADALAAILAEGVDAALARLLAAPAPPPSTLAGAVS